MRYRYLPLVALLTVPALSPAVESPLAASSSAFVRAQASSGVHWHAWNDATLAAAKQQKQSVYVFIGSPLSELTRATINQTFTSAKTVAWMNENFFCIFVDADERPDLAAYGQHYIRSIKQLQGVPVHLWLTTDLQIYDGANYLPPSEEWGKPGFLKAARSALDTWNAGGGRAQSLAKEAIDLMRVPALPENAPSDATAKLDAAAKAWIATIDPVNGGFGTAPKQPEPELIRFLLTRPDAASRDAAINAARALVKGACRDASDGGFYRRCIDEAWKEPYHQKTLLDQARIALALFDAADAAKDDTLRQAAIGALDFALKELKNPDGNYVAALDGTLEENADPAKRPQFVQVGRASTGSLGLLLAALMRADEGKRYNVGIARVFAQLGGDPGKYTFGHVPGVMSQATAVDALSMVGPTGNLMGGGRADGFTKWARETYFDETTGTFMAVPQQQPIGISLRTPAYGEIPSAETLALLAGVDAQTATRIRQALLSNIEYDDQPPGDVLLGLATK